jgi:DNA replication protein DnaC
MTKISHNKENKAQLPIITQPAKNMPRPSEKKSEKLEGPKCQQCGSPVKALLNTITGNLLGNRLCPTCEIKEQQQRHLAMIATKNRQKMWRQANIAKLLGRAGVPDRYRNCTLENFAGHLPRTRPTVLCGPCGIGKTHLAVGYLRDWIIENGCLETQFYRIIGLLRAIRGSFNEHADESENEVINRLGKESRFLVLDDLGAEAPTEFAIQTIYDIVDLRYSHELPLIITTNLTMDQIANLYGDRLASRLAGMGNVVELIGKDHRLITALAQGALQ